MCYKYLNGEYACKKLKRCTEKYEPFIVYCQNAKEEGQYCKDVRPIQKPIIIPVECSRHNQVRLDQFKKLFNRMFKEDVIQWAKVGTLPNFDKERKAALTDIFEPTELSEAYESTKDTQAKGFYTAILVAIETHIGQSLDELKRKWLTRVTPAASSSSTTEPKRAT